MPLRLLVVSIIIMTAADPLAAEPLDQRFGPDRERGYRSHNGSKSRPAPEPTTPRIDLQSPANIGMQR